MKKQTVGLKFGRLLVIEEIINEGTPKHKKFTYKCLCECGQEKICLRKHLVSGDTKSCGCLNNELYEKHGFHNHKLYSIHKAMVSRCSNEKNPKYKDYGKRGIFVCKEWIDSRSAFFEWSLNNGYEEGLEIERKNNNDGYYPENCEWITRKQQCRNMRSNIFISIGGIEKCISEWCEIYNLSKNAIYARVNLNWKLDENIILTPIKKRKKNASSSISN